MNASRMMIAVLAISSVAGLSPAIATAKEGRGEPFSTRNTAVVTAVPDPHFVDVGSEAYPTADDALAVHPAISSDMHAPRPGVSS